MTRPSIFDYMDYRIFLKDMFRYRKETQKAFSHRYFSRLAGFSSPNFLKLVMDGKRNLTHASIAGVSKGFKLAKQERDFFENLVYLNQVQDHAERDRYYRKMIAAKSQGSARKLETAQHEYFSRWYFPVIRELVLFGDRKQTPEEIAAKLNPPVKVKEVEQALSQLQALGLIRKDENGCWRQTDTLLSTGAEVKSLLVSNFHREMIRLAEQSISRFPSSERDITALTLSLDSHRLSELKQKIYDFRQQILHEYADDARPDQVIQINIQLFPLTQPDDQGEKA